MGKLIKVVLLLAVLVAAIALIVNYSKSHGEDEGSTGPAAAQQTEPNKTKGGMEVQEKYGFAPTTLE